MLFTTALFTLVYLPVVLLGFFAIARWSTIGAAGWLLVGSLVFYAQWKPVHTLLLVASMAANFYIGSRIAQARVEGAGPEIARRWLTLGIVANLSLLAVFKYLAFLIDTIAAISGVALPFVEIELPIGISFFTFTQIAFLCDTYAKGIREYRPVHYGLFVTYFPHLVAGPVLHHAQMMPQFARPGTYRFDFTTFSAGLVLFCIGLAKKIVIADGSAPYADAVFSAADWGASPTRTEAWIGALAYTFQLYFDFSGYSDMAVGLSLMLNIKMPFNFDSPYRSMNISEFWRRWHISLSNFLRDYLYIPIGGNRRGAARRYANLAITMLLGGLWHGASWTFVFWGGLHGAYLGIHHAYRAVLRPRLGGFVRQPVYRVATWGTTLLAVVVAWVYFRAGTFDGANAVVAAMFGLHAGSPVDDVHPLLHREGLHPTGAAWLLLSAACVALVPINSNRLCELALAIFPRRPALRDVAAGFALAGALFLVLVNETREAVSAFIYFNF